MNIRNIPIGGANPLVLFAGPCVVESRDLVLKTASVVRDVAAKHGIGAVFKSSYMKANRTSASSFTGIGMEKALKILQEVRREFDLPVVTDIHTEGEASAAAEAADVLQIPAFLCRQTGLLQAAGKTGRIVNIKKGQFLAPEDMAYAAAKVAGTGNTGILLTERGTTFGYHDLVVDMRSLVIMRGLGYPVVFDASHSVQLPGGETGRSAGRPEFIFPLARAGVAAGCDGLFVEVHPDPPRALSDASSQLRLDRLDALVAGCVAVDRIVRGL
jgi:2-dehydro-3-deoxyphosphooctonate aldolase (KDO 8-P synthase)